MFEYKGRVVMEHLLGQVVPMILPARVKEIPANQEGLSRMFIRDDGLRILVSVAVERDAKLWLHVSFSRTSRLPSHDDLRWVKDVFCGTDKTALQVFPPKEQYCNYHPNTLHLFVCLTGVVTPDFRPDPEGMPGIL